MATIQDSTVGSFWTCGVNYKSIQTHQNNAMALNMYTTMMIPPECGELSSQQTMKSTSTAVRPGPSKAPGRIGGCSVQVNNRTVLGIRRIWHLPNTTHSVLIPHLSDTLLLLDMFYKRMVKFVYKCHRSESSRVNVIARHRIIWANGLYYWP